MSSTHLLLCDQSGQYHRLRLGPGRYLLGRDPTAALVLDDPSVSRRHATVLGQDGRLVVEDLHSRTGTYVNHTRIRGRADLEIGDLIRIGRCDVLVCDGVPGPEQEEQIRALRVGGGFDEAKVLYALPSLSVPTDATATVPQLGFLPRSHERSSR